MNIIEIDYEKKIVKSDFFTWKIISNNNNKFLLLQREDSGGYHAAEADVKRNQDLVRLKKMPQWDVPLAELIPGELDYTTLHEQYTRWNFRTFLKELDLGRQGELL